jgi:hypothetical protein
MTEERPTRKSHPSDAPTGDVLVYATPPSPRPASARRVFWLLLPGALCMADYLSAVLIERAYPMGDSRNFGGACFFFVIAPFALVCGISAIIEAFRPRGRQALLKGLAWNLPVVTAPCIVIFTLAKTGLLRHF